MSERTPIMVSTETKAKFDRWRFNLQAKRGVAVTHDDGVNELLKLVGQ